MPGFKPLFDRVLVKVDQELEKTPGGLFVPGVAKEEQTVGVVTAAGPGRPSETTGEMLPMLVKVGDRVMIEKHAGADIEIEGVTYKILSAEQLVGVVEE